MSVRADRKKRERASREAALRADSSIVEHGTLNAYNAYGCRCRRCKDALKPRAINRTLNRCVESGSIVRIPRLFGRESGYASLAYAAAHPEQEPKR
jgi:hypothetical protein